MVFTESRSSYGTCRIKRALARQGFIVNRRRIGCLMREITLSCKAKRKFRATTNSKHMLSIAPNLLNRQFTVNQSDKYYVGDITYMQTESGWLYLAVVIDLFSRKIVDWPMADHMKAELVNNALLMVIWERKPDRGLMWHSDRGSQYASDSHKNTATAWHQTKHEPKRQLLG